MHLLLRTICVMLVALVASHSHAQADLLRCAALVDTHVRLQCYDTLAAELRTALAAESAELPQAAASSSNSPSTSDSASALPSPGTPDAASPPARNGILTALVLFGFESRPEQQREITEVLDRMEATVTSASHSPFSGWTLTLANGQVWKQIGSDRFAIDVGDTAVITRAALNSFQLQRAGTGRRIRVSRVE